LGLVGEHVQCRVWLRDLRDLAAAVQRCRRLLDLDTDPAISTADLARDPLIRPLLHDAPGLRVPGSADGPELAFRAVLGQQVSVAAARTTAGNLTRALGEPLAIPGQKLTHLFPTPSAIAAASLSTLPGPMPRRRTLQGLARALAQGEIVIDPGSDRHEVRAQLTAIPGIGEWTTEYIAMRALADPDAFLPIDLGVKRALARLGRDTTPQSVVRVAQKWRPWRAYAVQYLWATCVSPTAPALPSAQSDRLASSSDGEHARQREARPSARR
jgi:AraC family transcriptional regulator of adaptative response / DNA-3-methyladenine glycosylase II